MTAIVTDAHYRMAAALIRDLGELGVRVVVCEYAHFEKPLGFASRYADETAVLADGNDAQTLFELVRGIFSREGQKPVLFAVGAQTLALVSRQRERFAEVCSFLAPAPQTLDDLNDKAWTAEFASGLGVKVPQSFAIQAGESAASFFARVDYPCVIKPLCGEKFGLHAEKRYCIAQTPEQAEKAYAAFRELTGQAPVVQEYLPGEGAGCSVLAKNGEVLAAICHRRLREYPVTGGPSSCCECVQRPELEQAVKKIVKAADFSGVAMFEFKLDPDGEPRLLECNPRVWGTYPLTRVSGSNFAQLWLEAAGGVPLHPYQAPKPCKMRYFPSDLAAAAGYLRRGETGRFFAALGDTLSVKTKSGLFEWKDPKPAARYLAALLKGRGR